MKSTKPPVLGGDLGVCFDPTILYSDGVYVSTFSWRTKGSIAVVDSLDGENWGDPGNLPEPGGRWRLGARGRPPDRPITKDGICTIVVYRSGIWPRQEIIHRLRSQ